MAPLLVDRGANVNVCDNAGNTPLHHAVFRRDVDLLARILEVPDVKLIRYNCQGYLPLHLLGATGGDEVELKMLALLQN